MNNRRNSNKQSKPETIELLVHLTNGDILHVKESLGKSVFIGSGHLDDLRLLAMPYSSLTLGFWSVL